MDALEREEARLRNDLGGYGTGHQSEPTTPPEYRETGFPSALSRPNRFSTSGIISPPATASRSSRAGSQVSPPSERDRAYQALTGLPAQSVPGSRRESDEEEDDTYEDEVLNFDHRKAASYVEISSSASPFKDVNSFISVSLNVKSCFTFCFLLETIGFGSFPDEL